MLFFTLCILFLDIIATGPACRDDSMGGLHRSWCRVWVRAQQEASKQVAGRWHDPVRHDPVTLSAGLSVFCGENQL